MATAIKDIIQSIVNKMSSMNGYKKAWLDKKWRDLVGEEAGKHSRPYKVERDILFVTVDSSVWNQELFMNRANLIAKINKKFASKIVEDVKYQIGHFAAPLEKFEVQSIAPDINVCMQEKRRDILWDKNILTNLQRRKIKGK